MRGLFLIVPLASARAMRSPQQIPMVAEVAKNVAVEESGSDVAPSIGVHFTTSYALAVARYQNGTTRDIIKVEADTEYIGLMSRWMDSYSSSERRDDSWVYNLLDYLRMADIQTATGYLYRRTNLNTVARKTLRREQVMV